MKKSSKRDAASSTNTLSRFKVYVIPVIISIVLWYYLNSTIFDQVKHLKNRKLSSKPLKDKVLFNDERTARIFLTPDIALVNYYSDRRSNAHGLDTAYIYALEAIEDLIESSNLKQATSELSKLAKVSSNYANCPHLVYLSALLFDRLAEQERSNSKLKRSIQMYEKVVNMALVVDENLIYLAGARLVDRLEFVGHISDAIKYTDILLKRFADNLVLLNRQGINYLIADRHKLAKEYFTKVLSLTDNQNLVALCHFAFILKQIENKPNDSIEYFRLCLLSRDKSVMDGRFFYHLGDALQRIGRAKEAYEFYQIAVENGIFLSKYQRSIYNEKNLRAQPWWTLRETGYEEQLNELAQNWKTIRLEAEKQINNRYNAFKLEDENLHENGEWKEFAVYIRGKKVEANCAKVPITCRLVDKIEAARTCKRGQVKFSLLSPGVHIWPHCGPTNCRLRAHLGLRVPSTNVKLRVANETRQWREGEFIVFDDSFEHEVWHNGTETRLVLIVDLWHPDLSEIQKLGLTPI